MECSEEKTYFKIVDYLGTRRGEQCLDLRERKYQED
jgi:hypothetical protein